MTSPNSQESQQNSIPDFAEQVLKDGNPAPSPSTLLPDSILEQIQKAALQTAEEQIKQSGPQLVKNLEDYALQYTSAILAGQTTPKITVALPDSLNKSELNKMDARSRSARTLVQGFCVDLFFALIAAIGTLSGSELFSKAGLGTLAVLFTKTIVQTAVSYIARLKITPGYQEVLASTLVSQSS